MNDNLFLALIEDYNTEEIAYPLAIASDNRDVVHQYVYDFVVKYWNKDDMGEIQPDPFNKTKTIDTFFRNTLRFELLFWGRVVNRVNSTGFTPDEESVILELARSALADADTYDRFANKLDLSDDTLKSLQAKIEKETEGI